MYYQTHRIDQRGAGGSGNSENFINTNIDSGAEKPFGKCATEYSDNFETKKHFMSVNHRCMESPVGTMKFE